MMYSAAIPSLYVAGLLICFSMYWSDKILFLRHYKIPPRYGRDLAKRANKIMQFAILLHLFVGVYMLSNPDIFHYDDDHKIFGHRWTKAMGYFIERFFGVDPERWMRPHIILYMSGISIFILCFIAETTTGAMHKLVDCLCCCLDKKEGEITHSTDIYKEMSPEDQQHEFYMTNRELKKIEAERVEH